MEAKGFKEVNGVKMPYFDLVERYKDNQTLKDSINEFKNKNSENIILENKDLNLKAGDIVDVVSGYNYDMVYKVEIFGFDKTNGKAYLVWDCYWSTKVVSK